jgi:hypothetical protein
VKRWCADEIWSRWGPHSVARMTIDIPQRIKDIIDPPPPSPGSPQTQRQGGINRDITGGARRRAIRKGNRKFGPGNRSIGSGTFRG